jgi:hypothetical protein
LLTKDLNHLDSVPDTLGAPGPKLVLSKKLHNLAILSH